MISRFGMAMLVAAFVLCLTDGERTPVRASTFGDGMYRKGSPARNHSPLNPKHALLYAGDQAQNTVTVYDLSTPGAPAVLQITDGINSIQVISLDQNGTLYVGNNNAKSVTVYPFGATSPTLTMSDGATDPNCIAVAANGTVYVSGRGSPAVVDIYAPGESSPSQVITSPLISIPSQAILDSGGTLYVADNATGVYAFLPGSNTPISLNLSGLMGASGIALDERRSRLYVSSVLTPNPYVNAYTIGETQPSYSMQTVDCDTLAFGDKHFPYLFVPDYFASDVQLYRARGRTPFESLSVTYNTQGIAYKAPGIP